MCKSRYHCFVVLLIGSLYSWTPAKAEFVRGEINQWSNTHFMTQDAAFGNIWKVTITATNADASSDFKFDRNGDWSAENWGSATGSTNAIKNSTVGLGRYNEGSNGDLNFTGQSNTYRYSFNQSGESTWWDREYVVMETQNAPVTIPNAWQQHVQDPWSSITVHVQLSAAKSPEESIWIRSSTNVFFTTSSLIPASGSGTNYTATISGYPAGMRVWYYVLTSTMPSNRIVERYDLNTLRGKLSGATNFGFRVGPMNIWHFPTNAEPSGAFMRNPPTNGVLSTTAIYFYTGSQTGGTGNAADQSGMQLVHRLKGSGAWVTNSGGFDSSSGNNQYWIASITGNTYGATNEVEYYFRATATDHNTTYVGTTNGGFGNVLYLTEVAVQTAPFSFVYGAPVLNLGNAWHEPGNTEPPSVYMRNPPNAYSNNSVFIYNGNQFQGEGNAADQSGGTLYHRLVGSGSWTATNLSFDSQQGNNKYWASSIPAGTYGATNEVEYYLRITYSDRDTTYLGTTTNGTGSQTYGVEGQAISNAYRFIYGGEPGTEAGFIWHNSNRVVQSQGTVQFWTKIGFAQGDGTNAWVDNVRIYYTTNGAAVGVTGKGSGDANTLVQSLSFSHTEQDSSPNGNTMWWQGTVTNLPTTGNIRYKIGAWNGAGVQRFAEYNTDQLDNKEFVFTLFVAGADGLQVNGKNADYTASKFFVNERTGDSHPVTVVYTVPGTGDIAQVEVFSNLDRRDYADVDINFDGISDGIKPPLGNSISTNDTGAYFRAFPMTHLGGRTYQWNGTASKSGAYRLTGRYKLTGNTNWFWYSSDGRRDHAIVVSPRKALDMTLYEVNPLTVKATFNDENGRSTFNDLLAGNQDSFTNFNLGYLNKIQVNALWFQPIHPSADTTRGDPSGYTPGSPYATRNYYAVAPFLGRDNTEAGAMTEFTNFVHACDVYTGSVGSVHIMLDGVFNHTAWDAVVGQGGVDLGLAASPSTSMPGSKPGWYSYWQDYGLPANFYNGVYDNDIAVGPDRGDFGKWDDTADLYFGKYSALVRHNPDNNGDYLNEGDVYDFAGMSTDTVDMWRYFGYYTEYWLKKTGHPTNNLSAAYDDYGIDALRCDFGQGLPPQLWEYIINRTRKMKWNFVFMAETLDGGVPGYRSNRHFDILNENLVFRFTAEKINYSWQLRTALEDRRNAYSSGAVLLNLTGHDEVMPDNDPWVVASRYGSVSTVDGLPMAFYGQEQGIGNFNPADPDNKNDGFLHSHELNFGKYIPHFKQWNKLTVWENPPDFSDGLPQWYGRVNWARLNSPALRSQNRYFLNKVGGGEEGSIFAVAKYETPYASPTNRDVVLAFSLFLRHGEAHFSSAATYDLQGPWALLGLDTGKTYRIRNLAAANAYAYITNGWPRTGQDLWNNGIYVQLGGGTLGDPITADGQLVQYLKLEEVTPTDNQSPVITLPGPHILAVGASTGIVISVTDADSDPVTTNVTVSPAGSVFTGGTLTWTASPAFENTTNLVTVVADDQQGQTNSVVSNTTTIVVPFDFDGDGIGDGWEYSNFATLTNSPFSDSDGDGSSNADEYNAGTSPTNIQSVFKVTTVVDSLGSTNRLITVATAPGRKYTIYYADGSITNNMSWIPYANNANGIGTWIETNITATTRTFVDDQGPNTTTGAPAGGARNYRFVVGAPQ
jgi:hypothetical protein